MSPIDARKDIINREKVYYNTYRKSPCMTLKPKVSRGRYKIGDRVRISKYKRQFEKGYTPNWTEEIFVVDKIVVSRLEGDPITYKLKDLNGEEVLGSFYEGELSLAKQVIFRIESY